MLSTLGLFGRRVLTVGLASISVLKGLKGCWFLFIQEHNIHAMLLSCVDSQPFFTAGLAKTLQRLWQANNTETVVVTLFFAWLYLTRSTAQSQHFFQCSPVEQ